MSTMEVTVTLTGEAAQAYMASLINKATRDTLREETKCEEAERPEPTKKQHKALETKQAEKDAEDFEERPGTEETEEMFDEEETIEDAPKRGRKPRKLDLRTDIIPACNRYKQEHSLAALKKIIQKFGETVHDIAETDYPKFMQLLSA